MIRPKLALFGLCFGLLTHCADESPPIDEPVGEDASPQPAAESGAESGVDATRVPDDAPRVPNDALPDATNDAPTDRAVEIADVVDSGRLEAASDAPVTDAPVTDARTTTDGQVCGAQEQVAYNVPGCGAAAPPSYCQGPADACVTVFCDCSGQTFASGCGFATRPYRSTGACADGPDVRPDAAPITDARPDRG